MVSFKEKSPYPRDNSDTTLRLRNICFEAVRKLGRTHTGVVVSGTNYCNQWNLALSRNSRSYFGKTSGLSPKSGGSWIKTTRSLSSLCQWHVWIRQDQKPWNLYENVFQRNYLPIFKTPVTYPLIPVFTFNFYARLMRGFRENITYKRNRWINSDK